LVNANLVSESQSCKTELKIWREYENMIETEAKSQREGKHLTWFQDGGARLTQELCGVTMPSQGRLKLEGCKNNHVKGVVQ
jgi:hypothetical protein